MTRLELEPWQTQLWQKGLKEFNQGSYYQAHETLEDLWKTLEPPYKRGVQGLIQIAVAMVHRERGNFKGASGVWQKALSNLQTGSWPSGSSKKLIQELEQHLMELSLQQAEQGPAPNWSHLSEKNQF
jgi:predicted metal-dependent hydrolase